MKPVYESALVFLFLAMKEGRVIQSTGSWYLVDTGEEELIRSRLPGKFRLKEQEVTNPLAVGDYVELSINDDGTGTVQEIRDRENYLPRKATHGRRGEQILVANVDEAFVVQSAQQPEYNEGFIDRFLVTCEAYEVKGGIIINKMDLADDELREDILDLKFLYENLGYRVFLTSIEDEKSLQQLETGIAGQTSVFIGSSGVGKSSILNAIDDDLGLQVGEISSYSNKGKHTTTFARLIPLKNQGYVVDTPGIRELGLVNIEPYELSLFFPEMLEPRQNCKFSTCTHQHEPGCGVIQALEEGIIDPGRYHSYLQMLDSL
jgi:ribosome biogenesis GTPase